MANYVRPEHVAKDALSTTISSHYAQAANALDEFRPKLAIALIQRALELSAILDKELPED